MSIVKIVYYSKSVQELKCSCKAKLVFLPPITSGFFVTSVFLRNSLCSGRSDPNQQCVLVITFRGRVHSQFLVLKQSYNHFVLDSEDEPSVEDVALLLETSSRSFFSWVSSAAVLSALKKIRALLKEK